MSMMNASGMNFLIHLEYDFDVILFDGHDPL